jgi:hypothetical protein
VTTAYFVLKVLHLAAMATWLGAALWVPGDVKRAVGLPRPEADGVIARAGNALRLDLWAGFSTLVTGFLLLFAGGAGGHPRLGIMVGFLLTLALLALVGGGMLPAWRRVAARVAIGEDLTGAEPLARRLAMFGGIHHTLWFVALIVMVFPV